MHRSYRAAGLIALACTLALAFVVAMAPDAAFAATPLSLAPAHSVSHLFGDLVMAGPLALASLRKTEGELVTRAAAKIGEVIDGMAEDARRAIEAEHAGILSDLEATRAEIRTLEAAPRPAPATPAPAAGGFANADATRAATVAAAERAATISDIGRRAHMSAEAIDTALRNPDLTVEAFRSQAFEALATRDAATMTRSTGRVAEFGGQDADDSRRRGMADALSARMAHAGGDRTAVVPEHARAYAEMGLAEMAAECIGHRGALRTSRQVNEVFERAFHTVSDFPGIFVDALNVRLLARYRTATPTYRTFAALYTTTDFRPTYVIRAGDFPQLQPVNEAGEIKSGTFSESAETFRVKPYGVSVNLSRAMIVNDHLGAIDQVLGSVGERVTDWENAIAFAELLRNGNLLTDNTAVFHAKHNNLAGAGAAISVGSVGAGRAQMVKQKSLDGLKLNLQPKTLLVGPDNQTAAEQLFTAITPQISGNAVPESFRRMAPVADANLANDDGSAFLPWYLFADPAVAPCFVYGYLEGYEGPRLTSEQVFGVQGMKVKLEHDFGVAPIDFRGGYRNPGAAN
ncbi:hypothetical protein [Methylobacterium gnaphalii]|uniref:Bacteriophage Mu GpT domain-containing protein n=1 Tax=Methylobacterium gnaphalii TaxID=1010610 RepID=A0A512JPM4_9HYPH|nr:hypothetical protein [Methylobacterium gnaphalii]GEP11813.1 hypothetical protein MGN01_36580 [Methylobacterium gnaphalii]GJD70869.1 hypothetical protein MMMDOFMJ_3822 [Methylobacterium gnaphalii]GLS49552.1 hypothetical protein GCM10007885_24010 [Methylobacterium gnaphalii]